MIDPELEALRKIVADENVPSAARYDALKHLCRASGDIYQHVPAEQLRFVTAAMFGGAPFVSLKLRDAAEAVASGLARKTAPSPRT